MTTPAATRDDLGETARALSDGTRRVVLRLIQHAETAPGVRELAAAVDLHPNAVRKHVAILLDAGLIIERLEHSGSVGRPRARYSPNPDSVGRLGGWNPYEVLSVLLTTIAAGRAPREVGMEYGRRLASECPDASVSDLVESVMERHGFQPVRDQPASSQRLVLGRCPFAAAASMHPLVCDLHEGIATGLASCAGPHTVVLERRPPEHGGCLLTVVPTTEGVHP